MISSDRLAKIFNLHANTKFSTIYIYSTLMHGHIESREWSEGDDGGWQCQIQLCTHNVYSKRNTHTKKLMYKRMSHVICSVLFYSVLASLQYCILSWKKVCILNIRCHSSEVLRFRHSSSSFQFQFQFQCDCFDSFWSVLCFTLVSRLLAP